MGAPRYLTRRSTPERPDDLLRHECIILDYPSRAQRSPARRLFVEMARELAARPLSS